MPITPHTLSTSDRRGHAEVDRSAAPSTTAGLLQLGSRALLAATVWLVRQLLDYRWELLPIWTALPFAFWLSDLFTGTPVSLFDSFLSVVLLLAAVMLARLYWTRPAREVHQAHRALVRFRRSWPDHALALGLTRIDRRGNPVAPKVRRAENFGGGSFRWTLELPRGLTAADLERQAEQLAGAYRASSVMVDRDTRRANVATLTVIGQDDPLYGEPLPPRPLLELEPGRDPMEAVTLGYTSTGEPATVSLPWRSLLVGGSPNAGKSVILRALIGSVAMMRDTELWLCDPKRVEFRPWRHVAARVAVGLDEPAGLLTDLVAEMERRYVHMEDAGLQKLSPSAEWPMIVLVIDELADLLSEGLTKEAKDAARDVRENLRRLVALGRACLIVPVLATQKCDSSVCPTAIRDLIAVRLCLRTGTAAQTTTILGEEAVKELGATAHALGSDTPGIAYLYGEEGARVTRLRGYYLTSEDVEVISERVLTAREAAMDPLQRLDEWDHRQAVDDAYSSVDPSRCVDHQGCPETDGPDCPACFEAWQLFALDRLRVSNDENLMLDRLAPDDWQEDEGEIW